MTYDPTNPLIVQGDRSVLLEVDNPKYAQAREALAPFAELEKALNISTLIAFPILRYGMLLLLV